MDLQFHEYTSRLQELLQLEINKYCNVSTEPEANEARDNSVALTEVKRINFLALNALEGFGLEATMGMTFCRWEA
ncbi:hypothetical protein VNO77_17108 [Canavalia gladiata]|uniref:Uncharacterized protein n=1 Tax=Canavalia gladiata TaxID=3824 RepID=A0AAN9LN87_CANGL